MLYLSNAHVGGPTLVTDQRLRDTRMASQGCLVRPRENRLCLFEGGILHGVLPGRGACKDQGAARRVTLMVAFWPDMVGSPYDRGKAGPAQRMPSPGSASSLGGAEWVGQVLRQLSQSEASGSTISGSSSSGGGGSGGCGVPGTAARVAPVWEKVTERSRDRKAKHEAKTGDAVSPLPIAPYERCFQGF